MQIDHVDRVGLAHGDAPAVWSRLLGAHAITGLLAEQGEVRNVGPLNARGVDGAPGHSFTVRGRGGGRYHARTEERVEGSLIAYSVWREDAPESIFLVTYEVLDEGDTLALRGSMTGDIPVREVLAAFSSLLTLMAPMAERMVRQHLVRRMRTHLENLAAGRGDAGA